MWRGLLCDICECRIPLVHLEGEVEVSCEGVGRNKMTTLQFDLNYCQPCLTQIEMGKVRILKSEEIKPPLMAKPR